MSAPHSPRAARPEPATETDRTVAPAPPPHDDAESFDLPPAPELKRRTLVTTALVIGAVFAVLFVIGLVPRIARARQLREVAEGASGMLHVETVKPRSSTGSGVLTLPGSIDPLQETWVYARASGYVRQWHVDIGESVTEGQLLAELDTPEIDAQLNQARAQLAQAQTAVDQAKASVELARVTADRWDKLGPSGVASKQDVEEKRTQQVVAEANLKAADAAVDSQKANVNRLVDLKSFARVVAPFAGRVTARNTEKGQLVNAGAAGGQGLFRVADVETVRVFVHVPQDSASEIHVGQTVEVTLRETPGHVFQGKVTHTAGALDTASRSLNVEVQIPNADHALLAGMYAQASIALGTAQPVLRVPSAALIADSRGTRLMTVDGSKRLKSVPVQVGRDLGTEIEIVAGLSGGEDVVTIVPAGTPEGTEVEVKKADPAHS